MSFIHQEMDIESLEAANQSLQGDLKLAFKRIGDLQAAIEDEMASDDNDDLISRYRTAFALSRTNGVFTADYLNCHSQESVLMTPSFHFKETPYM